MTQPSVTTRCKTFWIALGPDYEYPLIHVLYLTLCLNGTRQTISFYAGFPLERYPLKRGLTVLNAGVAYKVGSV